MIYLLVFCFAIQLGQAQIKTFKFEDELCSYEGRYNATKYSEKELRDSYSLISTNWYLYYNDQIAGEAALQDLEHNYQALVQELNGYKIVNDSFFVSFKRSVSRYLEETYIALQAEIKGRLHPETLLQYQANNTEIQYWAQALQPGNTQLFTAFRKLTDEQKKNNSIPEYLEAKYQDIMNSTDAERLAFQEVFTYGWWNTVNHQIHHVIRDGSEMESFHRLFVEIKTIDCDEIDF